jgi:hypothetical protein
MFEICAFDFITRFSLFYVPLTFSGDLDYILVFFVISSAIKIVTLFLKFAWIWSIIILHVPSDLNASCKL